MADDKPATRKLSLTNDGLGPRSFFNANREAVTLRAGESWDGEILEADAADLSSDLIQGEAGAGSASESTAKAKASPEITFTPLDGLDKDGLLAVAREEGFPTIAEQDTLGEDEIRDAIELARQTAAAEIKAEAAALEKANSAKQLRELAATEKVELESDDNKPDVAFKIAYARYLAKAAE